MSNDPPDLVLCEFTETGMDGVDSFSPFCTKIIRALRAARLRYVSRRAADPGAFRALNPSGQVPILLVYDAPVCDSTRILARIRAMVPHAFPADARDARARGEALLWEELADTHLNGFLVAARWADERNWPAVRAAYFRAAPWPVRALVAPRIRARVVAGLRARDVWRGGPEACWSSLRATLDALEQRAPEGGFWLGDELSTADVSLFGQLDAFRTALTPWQRGEVEQRARLNAWLDRVDSATRAPRAARASERAAA
jgi:glutathione S-transferase